MAHSARSSALRMSSTVTGWRVREHRSQLVDVDGGAWEPASSWMSAPDCFIKRPARWSPPRSDGRSRAVW